MLIERNSGKKYKVTITSDHIMRVKVPESASKDDLELWTSKCWEMLLLLSEEVIQFTLRGHSSNPRHEKFVLHSEHAKKVNINKLGLFNFTINRKTESEKAQSQNPKKKCPFCGNEHDDLNVTFCYVCGYKL